MPRTPEELNQALADQVAMLDSSASGYDSGKIWEAFRLATTIYTLVNDGNRKSKSVLTQLGIRDKISFFTCAVTLPPGNMLGEAPLTMIYGPNYVPKLDNGPPWQVRTVPFKEWWSETVYKSPDSKKLSRLDLVFILRSQDGGSHFDEELHNGHYKQFKKFGIGAELDGEFRGGAPQATMRHIAFELRQSLIPYL